MSCLPMEQEPAEKQILTESMHLPVHAMQLDAICSWLSVCQSECSRLVRDATDRLT